MKDNLVTIAKGIKEGEYQICWKRNDYSEDLIGKIMVDSREPNVTVGMVTGVDEDFIYGNILSEYIDSHSLPDVLTYIFIG